MQKRTNRFRYETITKSFLIPQPVMTSVEAEHIVLSALSRWKLSTLDEAKRVAAILAAEFPDQAAPTDFWDSQAISAFRDFFVWGHDHDFGHGILRKGAMGSRHQEIVTEAIQYGMLTTELQNKNVLNVGCWTGGDSLLLEGFDAQVTAIEEHPVAARAASRLMDLINARGNVVEDSLYRERKEWLRKFDFVYCSGVIYHVTDPLLFLRIIFAYLKEGGAIFLESKAASGELSICSYSGTIEKGWNWFAPNEEAMGRWLVDAGFDHSTVRVLRRKNNRILGSAVKTHCSKLRETAGFSRPNSWLEETV